MFLGKLFANALNSFAKVPSGNVMCASFFLDEPECPKSIIEK